MKAVLFDMDGVIIDSEPYHNIVMSNMLDKILQGKKVDLSIYTGRGIREICKDLVATYNLPISWEELNERYTKEFVDYLENIRKETKPIDGIIKLLKELKKNNILTTVSSSSSVPMIEKVLSQLNIKDYFDEIISGDFVEKSKPEPEIFLLSAEKIGVDKSQCVIIEDSYNGVLAGTRAGIKVIGFKNLNSGNQDLSNANIIVNSISEINLEFLNNL